MMGNTFTIKRSDHPDAVSYYKEVFESLVDEAKDAGLVVTIHLKPETPLAMRNYKPVVEVRGKR
jgi:hypothetical protein